MMRKFIIFLLLLSFTLAHAQEVFEMPKDIQSRVSSFENLNGEKSAGGKTNQGAKGHAYEPINAGETKTLLNISASGIIGRIWCTVSNRSPLMLRSLRIRMYWDGISKPAVDVPLGDFFGSALSIPTAFQSALFANPEGRSFISYLPMPFRKGARITITNESPIDLSNLFFDVDYTLGKPSDSWLYFHACWNRYKKSTLGTDFEILPTVKGRGRFLGCNIGVNVDSSYGNTWWGEGEVKMYLDGDDKNPTINGTGAEDYTGTGWGLGPFINTYSGCTIADDKKHQYAFYRFHIPDPIFFQNSIRVTMQEIGGGMDSLVRALINKGVAIKPITIASLDGSNQFHRLFEDPNAVHSIGWMNFYRIDDYSATAYFYLDSPTDNFKELAPCNERVN